MFRRWIVLTVLALSAASQASIAGGLSDLFKQVKDSVVVIETTEKGVDPVTELGLVSIDGLGSGVLISEDGKIMTAAHVVQVADRIRVRFPDGEVIAARVLTSDPAADLALLQLEKLPANAHVAELGDSDLVQVGDSVFIVGAPLGLDYTLTAGYVSARREPGSEAEGQLAVEQFQTDAAVNPGNSGGPMFDMQGRVIGIVSYILSQGGGFEGLGFVITSNKAKELLLDQQSLWSGLRGQLLTGDLARILNVPQATGLLVERVADRSLASHLGLQGGTLSLDIGGVPLVLGGDIILECFGVSLDGSDFRKKLRARMVQLKAGDEIMVRVLRGGQIVELTKNFYPDLLIPAVPTN
jgi:S1-C subfamily serine protease